MPSHRGFTFPLSKPSALFLTGSTGEPALRGIPCLKKATSTRQNRQLFAKKKSSNKQATTLCLTPRFGYHNGIYSPVRPGSPPSPAESQQVGSRERSPRPPCRPPRLPPGRGSPPSRPPKRLPRGCRPARATCPGPAAKARAGATFRAPHRRPPAPSPTFLGLFLLWLPPLHFSPPSLFWAASSFILASGFAGAEPCHENLRPPSPGRGWCPPGAGAAAVPVPLPWQQRRRGGAAVPGGGAPASPRLPGREGGAAPEAEAVVGIVERSPTPLQRAGMSSTRCGCSEPPRTWPGVVPGLGHRPPLWATGARHYVTGCSLPTQDELSNVRVSLENARYALLVHLAERTTIVRQIGPGPVHVLRRALVFALFK